MLIIVIFLFLIVLITIYHHLFSIYEVEINLYPQKVYSGKTCEVNISAIAINALGKRILFRSIYTNFKINSGRDLIDDLLIDSKKGKMILKVKGNPGKIVVYVKCKYALFPSEVEIPILPNLSANIQ